ncbi:hypothetical protein [Paracidovorax avenae]|uniref:hypothetical protein n=1 Tax=Paracidovorax avenae TaxID=80867 RepID=UPI001863CE1C|nr:hypothetical protein [Paracidovorax avenae]
MADPIRKLTPELLAERAREAARQGVPLEEANHHEPGSTLWVEFNAAYMDEFSPEAG